MRKRHQEYHSDGDKILSGMIKVINSNIIKLVLTITKHSTLDSQRYVKHELITQI